MVSVIAFESAINMELTLYLSLVTISAIFTVKRQLLPSNSLFFLLFFGCFSIMSILVRLNYDGDIIAYAESMDNHWQSFFYYAREPVVWYGHQVLFKVLNSTYWAFVVFDLIIGLILYRALKRYDVPQYLYFSMLTFFPFVLGFQNAYRQWVAAIILLYAISLARKSNFPAWFWFFVAALSHNVAGIFVSFMLAEKQKSFGKLAFVLSIFITPVAIYIGAGTKTSAATGLSLELAYLALLFSFVLFYAISDKLRIKMSTLASYKFLFLALLVSIFATLFLSSAGAERVMGFALILLYPSLALKIEDRFKQKVALRLVFAVAGFVPLLVFGVRFLII